MRRAVWRRTLSLAGAIGASRRWATDAPVPTEEVTAKNDGSDDGSATLSTHVDEDAGGDEGEFDIVEAGLQEAHDLLCGMEECLQLRSARIAEQEHDFNSTKFHEYGAKLSKVLTDDVIRAMMKSAQQRVDDNDEERGDAIDHYRSRLTRANSAFFKHAPFEFASARANAPEYMLRWAKAERDSESVKLIMVVCGTLPYNVNSGLVKTLHERFEAALRDHSVL